MRFRNFLIFGLSLSLLAICGLIVAILWASIGRGWNVFRRVTNSQATVTETSDPQRYQVGDAALLTVDNTFGNITVTAAKTEEVVVTMTKSGWGGTEQEARTAMENLQVNFTHTGNSVIIRVVRPPNDVSFDDDPGASAAFEILVPEQTSVDLGTLTGGINLEGTTGAANLKTDFGNITVNEVAGELIAKTASGEITARDVVAGREAIELTSDFGEVRLENASGASASLHSSSGRVGLYTVTLTGAAAAETDFGSVVIENVQASNYDLHTSSGKITVSEVSGPIKAHTDFGDVTVTEAISSTLDLRTSSGSITFEGVLGDGPHLARTDFGSITLRLPALTALNVDLKTDFGSLKTAFSVTVSGSVSEGEGNHIVGPINGGGERLEARTSSGNVYLEFLKP